ncbi:MAG: hypothetical protein DI634_07135 [Kocuria palustris]|nr:MAG: hypothetical protein DI634_07135 [Kocuria palustris]
MLEPARRRLGQLRECGIERAQRLIGRTVGGRDRPGCSRSRGAVSGTASAAGSEALDDDPGDAAAGARPPRPRERAARAAVTLSRDARSFMGTSMLVRMQLVAGAHPAPIPPATCDDDQPVTFETEVHPWCRHLGAARRM